MANRKGLLTGSGRTDKLKPENDLRRELGNGPDNG